MQQAGASTTAGPGSAKAVGERDKGGSVVKRRCVRRAKRYEQREAGTATDCTSFLGVARVEVLRGGDERIESDKGSGTGALEHSGLGESGYGSRVGYGAVR
ncbi:hypothetical protein B0H16DRAFT_1476193 [Mycena metata]|uniref:Uncharacterized protein n=1 Tax=Mycena metata TaxID=1033252 RepID=A0AAD7HCQ2_9AGAR|nr:hypothetical protein B0H16DRAFT_1476193 [Mycena metata]